MHDAFLVPPQEAAPSPTYAQETETGPWTQGKAERKARRLEKRLAHQAERARVRENLQAGLKDPEVFLDLEGRAKNIRRMLASGKEQRRALLAAQKRKARAELANTRDLDTFLAKSSRSRTLHSLVALAYFRHVLRSEEYREDHRFKEAIRRALEEPGLAKSIQRRWEGFDREFPGQDAWEKRNA
jgi:hypothetical protein